MQHADLPQPPTGGGGSDPPHRKRIRRDGGDETTASCCICEEEFSTHANLGTALVRARALTPDTLVQFCTDPTHSRMCVECLRTFFRSSPHMPQCPTCHQPCGPLQGLELLDRDDHASRSKLIHVYSMHQSIHQHKCPKCNFIGHANHNDGIVRFDLPMETRCWNADGSHATHFRRHVNLCEECLGPAMWCMCASTSRTHHLNHYYRELDPRKPQFLLRNHQITDEGIGRFLRWLITFDGPIPVMCPGCRRLLWRTDACHELKCCGYKICFCCGYGVRGPQILDHYDHHGGCPLFEKHFLVVEGGKRIPYPCSQACQSQRAGDCAVPEHQQWRNRYNVQRRRLWGQRFLQSLSPKQRDFAGRWLNTAVFPRAPRVRVPEAFVPVKLTGPKLGTLPISTQRSVWRWIRVCEDSLT